METAVTVALVAGVTEALKRGFKIPSRYAVVVSLALGVASAYFLTEALAAGLIVGLSASGLYSGGKALLNK